MFSGLMLNTWIAATAVAVIAGVTGFFAVLRGSTFAAHAIPNGAFAGAAGASLLGLNAFAGLAVFSVAGALGIAGLSRRSRPDVATALTFVMMLAFGALFVSWSSQYAQEAYSLLFGEVFGVSAGEVRPILALGAVSVAAVVVMFRPLMLSSALPEVAEARGVSPRRMELGFLLVMALATSMSVPVVGALLMFSLMIGPAAAARSLTARPALAMTLSVAIALVTVWAGIALSYQSNWPLGFFVGIMGAGFFLLGRAYRAIAARTEKENTFPQAERSLRYLAHSRAARSTSFASGVSGWRGAYSSATGAGMRRRWSAGLFDRLTGHFGQQQVVKDVDSTQLGPNFAEVIAAAVASCDAFLVLIGHQWLTAIGQDGVRRLYDPDDYVRLEIESALTRGVQIIPVLIDGARMPPAGELPPSLAGLARQQALELSPNRLDPDTTRLLRVLDQSIAERQATQAGPVVGQRTVTGPPPAWPPPAGRPAAGQTKPMPRGRLQARTMVLIGGGAIAAAIVAFIALPGSPPAPSSPVTPYHASLPKTASSPSPFASPKVIVTDDFSTKKINWVDDFHQAAGAYTGNGAYRLSVTGADGQSELARPASAAHGLGDVTPLNLSLSVDARRIAGAAQGYGYGIAFRSDGSGDFYAFVIQDHAVAIQKWVGNGARVQGSPPPVATSAVHADAADRLQAVCVTADGGKAVHLELWLNGKKLVDFTDQDHPYTKGYLGLYVQSISDTTSTAEAEFGNFAAALL